MPENTHVELASAEAEPKLPPAEDTASETEILRSKAAALATNLVWLPNERSSRTFFERSRTLAGSLGPLLRKLDGPLPKTLVSDDFRWLHGNARLLGTELHNVSEGLKRPKTVVHVRTNHGTIVPRTAALAEDFLAAVNHQFTEQALASYVEAFEEIAGLQLAELWALPAVLKLVLLEQLAARSPQLLQDPNSSPGVAVCMRSLREIGHTTWKDVLEPLVPFDRVLREDPAGAYPRMDFESRDLYRDKVAKIAKHADLTETEVAIVALALAREAQKKTFPDPRTGTRQAHIGYYLLAEGVPLLHQRVGYKAPFVQRMRSFMRAYPDEIYLSTIEVLMFALVVAILLPIFGVGSSLSLLLLSLLVLVLPCSQSAVRLANHLITTLLPAEILPKLDFSEGIPGDCVTMVAIPTLLLNEKQIHQLVDDLEVRYLANHDPNVYFVLLSDLPDSLERAREDDARVLLASKLITELNEKYAAEDAGGFLLLHRHRVYNPRERMWMGWERKRGKLLDLNQFLRNKYDSFPIKTGDLSVLPKVRFVITLDSDTGLPRDSAHRMVGALAHPLSQAIIDPEKNIVVAGYGILQPRVGVTVQSAARSRLASIYSGETGLDIYTRAVSDVYQDLYGEGSFVGKGIYEVETLHRVLDRRFPQNALLSHDLIEGAYARAGLASDIEIVEDYPSHYRAHNHRKHRWLRGDWQITGWLARTVSDESGSRVPNPISLVSMWKILDNLRRSLVEPATFLLLVLGWLVLPGTPLYWTLATLVILVLPAWFRFAFSLTEAAIESKSVIAREAIDTLFTANVSVFFSLTFLAHQTFLSLDAVVRTLVRSIVTRQRLLQWETAAEAEIGTGRTSLDVYLRWMPGLAIGLGGLVYLARPSALPVAIPILLLWGLSKPFSLWLNRSSHDSGHEISAKDRWFLRRAALRTWRYFAEFSTAEHNWLIPDNVQEEPPAIAARISPTNLGFLFNARQVACEFGYLTVPEFAEQTLRTLDTVSRLTRYRGHFLNWYDTRTLEPLPPQFISSADSGNLVASLWTLEQGCMERLHRPVVETCLAEGLLDCLRILFELHALPRGNFANVRREMNREQWLPYVLALPDAAFDNLRLKRLVSGAADAQWFAGQAHLRVESVKKTVCLYAPWLLPEFASLHDDPILRLDSAKGLALESLPAFVDALATRLQSSGPAASQNPAYQKLLALLPEARSNAKRLIADLRKIAASAGTLAHEMDFQFLLERRRKLLSVGFDVASKQLNPACYDLLASESRTAAFAAIAKEHIPQETWFMLGRAHTVYDGRPVLLSWTGTMFEYLLPAVWMLTYPNTLLDRSQVAAVRSQQRFAEYKHVPWGISESAYFEMDEAGNYQYRAFGIPQLALSKPEPDALVVSPYSSFLALSVDTPGTMRNLRHMASDGWFGAYGFYEAVDFTPSRRRSRFRRYEVVRSWMSHHQGMSLLAVANLLYNGVVQRWFHSEPRVQATQLLLQEKPVSHVPQPRVNYETLAG
jgi:cyclic beta-1,2-glucan synthetase